MYKSKFIALFFFLVIPFTSFSEQVDIVITGKAIDSLSQKGIPFVTVTVQDLQSKVLKRLAGDANGNFEFSLKGLTQGEVIVTAIGYASVTKKFTYPQGIKKYNIGHIAMPETSTKIDQVVVQAQKQLVKIEPDKISYNPEADPESQTINALDMIRKVPLLTVDGDDNIKLKGASNYKILINGKESPLMSNNAKDVLKSMPASSIKNIEVITNPSSKYSAEGIGGIINIITNKKGVSGFSGNVSTRIDNFGGFGGSLYTTAKLGKFAFSVNYGYSKFKQPASKRYSNTVNSLSESYRNTYSNGLYNYDGNSNYASGELSFEIDSLNLITGSFWGHLGGSDGNSFTTTEVTTYQGTLFQKFTNENISENSWGFASGNFDYQRSFKKPDKLFTISYKVDYTPNNTDYNNNISAIANYNPSKAISKNKADAFVHTFQVDFVNPITPKHQYEVGIKYIVRTNDSKTRYRTFDFITNTYNENIERNNNLNYTQQIVAGYLGYLLKLNKFSFKAGIRIEGAYTDASFIQVKDTAFSNNITDIVPYTTISYNISPTNIIKLSYTQRLQRPGIWHLNPYINDQNPKDISFGNPNLKSEKVNSFDLGYSYFSNKFNIDLSLYSRLNSNAIQDQVFIRPDGAIVQTYDNNGDNNSFGVSFFGSFNAGPKFSISGNINAEYNTFEGISSVGQKLTKEGWNNDYSGNLRWNFIKNYTLSAYGGYYSGWLSLQGKSSSFNYSGINLRRDFFDKKLSITASCNNPFKKNYTSKSVNDGPGFYSINKYISQSRSFRFAISYRFGKMGQTVVKAKRGIVNDDIKSGGNNSGGSGNAK